MSNKAQGDGITLEDLKDYHNRRVAPFLGSSGGGGGGGADYSSEIASLSQSMSEIASSASSLSTENSTQTSEINSLSTATSELASETTEIGSEVDVINSGMSNDMDYTGFEEGASLPIYPSKGVCHNVGEIVAFYAETAPNGFLVCDGTAYNKTDYPELWAVLSSLTDTTSYVVDGDNTKFKVPDLRGEFLRGTGTNGHTNQGSGASVGVHQDGTEMPYTELYNTSVNYFTSTSSGLTSAPNKVDSRKADSSYAFKVTGSYSSQSGFKNIFTSRPTNTSVLFCIAYKNIYITVQTTDLPVDVSAPTEGQSLIYDATEQKWVNGPVLHRYSTTEKVVGTWIDGRPIYEITKVFNNIVGTVDGGKKTYLIDEIQNVDDLVNGSMLFSFNNGDNNFLGLTIDNAKPPLPQFTYFFGYIKTTHSISINAQVPASASYAGNCFGHYTVQYTKTTDTPTVQS